MFLAAAAAVLFGCASAEKAPAPFTAATFNIKNSPEPEVNAWDLRRDSVAKLIKKARIRHIRHAGRPLSPARRHKRAHGLQIRRQRARRRGERRGDFRRILQSRALRAARLGRLLVCADARQARQRLGRRVQAHMLVGEVPRPQNGQKIRLFQPAFRPQRQESARGVRKAVSQKSIGNFGEPAVSLRRGL